MTKRKKITIETLERVVWRRPENRYCERCGGTVSQASSSKAAVGDGHEGGDGTPFSRHASVEDSADQPGNVDFDRQHQRHG